MSNKIQCNCDICCKCNCRLRKVLSLILESALELDKKRLIIEELLDEESEAFFPIQDKLSLAGAELLSIDLNSAKGDDYISTFFDAVFGKYSVEEVVNKLLEL
jgi:hypothetical protein